MGDVVLEAGENSCTVACKEVIVVTHRASKLASEVWTQGTDCRNIAQYNYRTLLSSSSIELGLFCDITCYLYGLSKGGCDPHPIHCSYPVPSPPIANSHTKI